jgi:WD40 repeat protein
LLSAGVDRIIVIWNTKTQEAITQIDVHGDNINSISWNYNGSYFATTCKDKKLRVINARTGEVVSVGSACQFNLVGQA